MNVHAIIPVYNDRTFLVAALESIKPHVKSIIVADGAYQLYYDTYLEHNPRAQPWSTDGTLQIIKSMHDLPPTRILHCPEHKPWLNQCVKRSALLKAVPDDDWFIVIDADEMLYGDVEEGLHEICESGCLAGRVPLYNTGLDTSRLRPFWHPRIFHKQEGMHYHRKHWFIRDSAGRIIENTYPIFWTDQFVFAHFKTFKPHERQDPHYAYMRVMSEAGWLEPHEGPFNI